jgi:hypothetical protein
VNRDGLEEAYNSGYKAGKRATLSSDVFKNILASLVAAVSLLKRGGKKAAASDKMFEIMLSDYDAAIEAGRNNSYKEL